MIFTALMTVREHVPAMASPTLLIRAILNLLTAPIFLPAFPLSLTVQ